jgi:perosamine synthetase
LSTFIPHSRPWITLEDKLSISNCLHSDQISSNGVALDFTDKVCKLNETLYGKSLSSGTSAIALSLKVLGISSGDEVILPTYVCHNVLDAILSVNAVPKFSDVNIFGVVDYEEVAKIISKKTKAIIAVHIFGNISDIPSLKSFGVPVIEDACQAFGLNSKSRRVGSMGDIGVYSFHATKIITTGEGGMLVTNNLEYAEICEKHSFESQVSPMSDLQASLGLAQVSRLKDIQMKRNSLKQIFNRALNELNLDSFNDPNSENFFRFTVKFNGNIERKVDQFYEYGISLRRGVDELLHRSHKLPDDEFPQAVNLFNSLISIPFYPSLIENEIDRILQCLPNLKND